MLRIVGHLIATGFRAFFRVLATAVIFGAIGLGAVALVVNHFTHQWPWPPSHVNQVTTVALVGVAALAAYAGGATMLMAEAVRGLLGAARVVEHEAVAPIKAVEQELEGGRK
jgi:hypothetical protein